MLVAIAVGLFYLYINPHYMNIRDLMQQRSDYKMALANIEEVKALRDSLESQLSGMPPQESARLELLMPTGFNSVKLITDLDAVAGRHGMSLRGVKMVEETSDSRATINNQPKKGYRTSTLSFGVVSTYQNFVAFLRDMEKSLELVDVKAVSMNSTGAESSNYQFEVTIQTYWIE